MNEGQPVPGRIEGVKSSIESSKLFTYGGQLREWAGNNKLDVVGWGFCAVSLPNIGLGYLRGGIYLVGLEAVVSLGLTFASDNILHASSRQEKIWNLIDGVVASAGGILMQTGNPDLFLPGLAVGFVGSSYAILHWVTSNDHPIAVDIRTGN